MLKILAGVLEPDVGQVEAERGFKIGYYIQESMICWTTRRRFCRICKIEHLQTLMILKFAAF